MSKKVVSSFQNHLWVDDRCIKTRWTPSHGLFHGTSPPSHPGPATLIIFLTFSPLCLYETSSWSIILMLSSIPRLFTSKTHHPSPEELFPHEIFAKSNWYKWHLFHWLWYLGQDFHDTMFFSHTHTHTLMSRVSGFIRNGLGINTLRKYMCSFSFTICMVEYTQCPRN